MMPKKYTVLFSAGLLWIAFGTCTHQAFATPTHAEVNFEATPLFHEANFMPGSDVRRWATVKNNTPDTRPIIVEAIHEYNPDGLADFFEIGIYENGMIRYATTTLTAFFNAGEIVLSHLAGKGAKTRYDFLVRFVPTTDNSYQEKTVRFDIRIGLTGGNTSEEDDTHDKKHGKIIPFRQGQKNASERLRPLLHAQSAQKFPLTMWRTLRKTAPACSLFTPHTALGTSHPSSR